MTKLFKFTILAIAFVFSSFTPNQVTKKWIFKGITISEPIPNCNTVRTKAGYVWLLKDENITANIAAMEKELHEKFGKSNVNIETATLDWDNYVALVKKKIKCGGSKQNPKRTDSSYRFVKGKSKESIIEKLDKEKKDNYEGISDVIDYDIIEWIDLKAESEKLDSRKNRILGKDVQ